MGLLQKKYTIEIITTLGEQPLSFNELQKSLSVYSDTLSRRIKELEKARVVETTITESERGKRIRYVLSKKGMKILPHVKLADSELRKAEELL